MTACSRKIAALAGFFLFSSASFGYIRLLTNVAADTSPAPLFRTDNKAIQFLLNSNVVPGLKNASGATVISSGSDPLGAVRASLATWNTAGANIKFLPLKSTNLGIDSNDNAMVVAVAASAAEVSAVGGALAVTATFYATSDGLFNGATVSKGAILDTDIIVNPAFSFSTDGSTSVDLQSVITHELGHSLGANHTGLLGATMFQFNAGQRFLTTDDLALVNSVYPSPSGGAAHGTISGTVTAGGAPVPYALLTAFDTSAGVTVGGVANPDGTYSIETPPGNYQIYAEPLNGVLPISVYLTSDQLNLAAATKFKTTLFSGSFNVASNSTATVNIAVTSGASSLATPVVAVSPVNGLPASGVSGGPATIPSGQSVDLILAGPGYDATLNDSSFAVYGPGISLVPGSVRVDPKSQFVINNSAFNLLRLTLKVDARNTPSLASFIVTSGSNVVSFSGALVIVPPTPTFVSAGVISAAPYAGIPSGVSPGGIYSIYDIPNAPNLGPVAAVFNAGYDAYGNLPTILAGVSVTFDGVPAPMFYSSAGQLNFQVPFEVAGRASTQVVVNYLGSAGSPATVPVLAVQPGLFTLDGKAVIALNRPSFTLNTAQNPAPQGSLVEIYGTGVGKVGYTVATGRGAPGFPTGFTGNYTYSVGGSPAAPAIFGGWTPGSVGLAQWDVLIPTGIATGAVPITVTDASGAASQPGATIFVK